MHQRFPYLVPIEYHRHKALKPGAPDAGFTGSIDNALITEIVAIKCAECNEFLIEADSPSVTGLCGHNFCFKCANKLYCNYPQVRNVTTDDIEVDLFEIKLDGRPRQPLYKCKSCKKKKYIFPSLRNGLMSIFSRNIMLTDFYAALKKPGFLCKSCPNDKPDSLNMHPMYNSLRCQNSSSNNSSAEDNESGPTYICVWHADKHNAGSLTIMDPSIQAEELGPNQRLASLDRSTREVFAPFYHCACCSNYLHHDKRLLFFKRKYSHLECGHFVGSRCAAFVRDKLNTTDGVYCIFCNKDYVPLADTRGKKYFNPRSKIAGIVTERIWLTPCVKKACEKCNASVTPCKSMVAIAPTIGELFQHGIIPEKTCQWCLVEHKLNGNCVEKPRAKKYGAVSPAPAPAPAAYDNNIDTIDT